MLLKGGQLRPYVLRFRPSCVGRCATTHVGNRLGKLEALRAQFYGKQLFGPSSDTSILRFFADAAAYSTGRKKLVGTKSLLYQRENPKEKETDSREAPMNDDASKRRRSFEHSKLSMLGRNRHSQLLLSDESILVLTIMKHVAEVSEQEVRKDLKIGDGLVAKDEALGATWAEALEKEYGSYRRDVTIDELRKQAAKVELTFSLPASVVDPIPMRRRLELQFKKVRHDHLNAELQCHLPLFLLCMRTVTEGGSLPKNSDPLALGRMKCLMACLLPTRLPLSALSSLELKTIAEAPSAGLRRAAVEKVTKVEWCFNARGAIMKGKALKALEHFSWGAARILEFLGNYRPDSLVASPVLPQDAGSSGAMFIIGPFLFGPENRMHIGCEVASEGSRVAFLPKHGVGGFESAFATVCEENTAVEQALA